MKRLIQRCQNAYRGYLRRRSLQAFVGYCDRFYGLFELPRTIVQVVTGFESVEGMVWLPAEQHLLFSDPAAETIYRFNPVSSTASVFRQPSGGSSGLVRDRRGRLISCDRHACRVTRQEKDGTLTVLADRFQDEEFVGPKDVLVARDGAMYFTDVPDNADKHPDELFHSNVYCLSPQGALTRVASNFKAPNGLAFTPSGRQIYINDADLFHIRRFDRQADGRLTNEGLFCTRLGITSEPPSGMAVDVCGTLFATGAGGVWLFSPERECLGMVWMPEPASSCGWGDRDYRSLYVAGRTSLYRLRMKHPGVRW